jgi:hypothetical protein
MTYVLPVARSRGPESCVSDFALDRWRLGELSAGEQAATVAHLYGCRQCREREQAVADAELPALDVLALWRAHSRPRRRRSWHWLVPVLGPSAVLALGVLLLVAIRSCERASDVTGRGCNGRAPALRSGPASSPLKQVAGRRS